jgi:protein involved in polysaccharide export with SLBB domain
MNLFRMMKNSVVWSCLFCVALMWVGCVNDGPPTPPLPGPGTTTDTNNIVTEPSSDLLEPGNTITVSFSGLSTVPIPYTCRIREDGTISPPYLDKQIRAAGKTIGTLEQELEKEYVPKIYRTINVTIRTADRFYFVGGEVRQPSRQPYVGRITVTQAIQSAGDFTDFADQRKVRVIRANNKVQIVDCKAALENPTKDALIYPGDRIVVDSKLF